MDLTTRYVNDSRQAITDIETADITNPDLPRPTITGLTTRLTETLRTMADHAERLTESHNQLRAENNRLRAENSELESQVRALHEALTQTPTAA